MKLSSVLMNAINIGESRFSRRYITPNTMLLMLGHKFARSFRMFAQTYKSDREEPISIVFILQHKIHYVTGIVFWWETLFVTFPNLARAKLIQNSVAEICDNFWMQRPIEAQRP